MIFVFCSAGDQDSSKYRIPSVYHWIYNWHCEILLYNWKRVVLVARGCNLRAPPETIYTIVEKCLECGLGHKYAEVVGLYGRDSLKVADKLSSEIRHNGECGYVVYGVAYRKYKSVDG